MPYTAEISRTNPTCFLFMVDQSRSMSDEIAAGDATQQKATGVADTVNRWMQELSLKVFSERMDDKKNLPFAEEHHDIIARFGRFPHRNTVLGRESTPEELAFLEEGGFKG